MNGNWTLVSWLIDKLGVGGTPAATVINLAGVLLCIVVPYLLGSVNFGVLISNQQYHDDVRDHGSGNAGTTNMLRTYGAKAAVLTMAGDMLKAVIAVGLGYLIVGIHADMPTDNGTTYRLVDSYGAAIAGLFVVLGHMFPVFFKFKGGKGVATSAMVVLMLSPMTFLICALVFVIIVAGTRYVSLGSIMGIALYPVILNALSHAYDPPRNATACMLSVLMAVLVIFMHRENIKRLWAGKESKISFKKQPPDESTPAPESESPVSQENTSKRKNQKKKPKS